MKRTTSNSGSDPSPSNDLTGDSPARHDTATWGGGRPELDLDLPARWQPIRLLGRGGQAEVWLAEDTELGLEVAVKVMTVDNKDSSQAARLRREVRTARDVAHPHLIRIFELIEKGSNLAIIMEFLPGGTVSERIKQGPIPAEKAVIIAEQVLEALKALHDHGIVHRDVKPSNILLDEHGAAKLADLGTVRPVHETSALTRTAAQVGTPAYMSPEQLRGVDIGPPSDLYSLGVTLYRMLTGELPFQAKSDFALAHHHLNSTPAPVRQNCRSCPRWLARFTERLLEKDAADRWPSADAALIALRQQKPGTSGRARRRNVAWLLATLTTAIAGLAWWFLTPGPSLETRLEARQVIVSDDQGTELWRRPAYEFATNIVVGDLMPARGLEVATAEPSEGARDDGFDLVVSSRDGRPLTRTFVSLGSRRYPDLSLRFSVRLLTLDLDKNGRDEVLYIASHNDWYASFLGLWQPDQNRGARRLLDHSGHLHLVASADLDGDGLDEILVSGVNNPLGFQTVVAALDSRTSISAISPDMLVTEGYPKRAMQALLAYVVLGDNRVSPVRLTSSKGAVTFETEEDQIIFDRSSLLFAPGSERVRSFWLELAEARGIVNGDASSIDTVTASLAQRHPDLWSDSGFRGAAKLHLALAAAEGDEPGAAGAYLAASLADGAEVRRMHRIQGELQLINNNRAAGIAALRAGIESRRNGFAPTDEVIDLGLLAALEVDRQLATSTDELFRSMFNREDQRRRQLGVVQSFMAGDFAACEVAIDYHSGAVYGARVLQLWARLETGGDVRVELETLIGEPENRNLAQLAIARSKLFEGRISEARTLAEQALWRIKERSRTSWPDFVWRVLGEWVLGSILEAADDPAAAEHLAVVTERAPRTFFGKAVTEGTNLIPDRGAPRIEVTRDAVIGRDQRGEPTWRLDLELPVMTHELTDVDGDGVDEAVIVLRDDTDNGEPGHGPIVQIVKADHSLMTRLDVVNSMSWPFSFDLNLQAGLEFIDIDRDGRSEVVAFVRHTRFYPATTFIYWPDHDRWDHVFVHPGYVRHVIASGADSPPGLRFLGVNNLVGVLPFVGGIQLASSDGKPSEILGTSDYLIVPPLGSLARTERYAWEAYVPLDPSAQPNGLENLANGGLRIHQSNAPSIDLDRFWNPTSGANAGLDLRAERLEFPLLLTRLKAGYLDLTVSTINQIRYEAKSLYHQLLSEKGYLVALEVQCARALARAGDANAGIEVLSSSDELEDVPDVAYRVAHFEAVQGHLDEALEVLEKLTASKGNTRNSYDGPMLQLMVATAARRPDLVEQGIERMGRYVHGTPDVSILATLRTQHRLWIDRLEPEDAMIEATSFHPAGGALSALARWRRGSPEPADIEAFRSLALANPSIAAEATLAVAATLIAGDEARIALTELRSLIAELEIPAQEDFTAQRHLILARALRALALEAAGEKTTALSVAREVVAEGYPDLLPAILAREVIDRLQ